MKQMKASHSRDKQGYEIHKCFDNRTNCGKNGRFFQLKHIDYPTSIMTKYQRKGLFLTIFVEDYSS